jgi:hypothetical protein
MQIHPYTGNNLQCEYGNCQTVTSSFTKHFLSPVNSVCANKVKMYTSQKQTRRQLGRHWKRAEYVNSTVAELTDIRWGNSRWASADIKCDRLPAHRNTPRNRCVINQQQGERSKLSWTVCPHKRKPQLHQITKLQQEGTGSSSTCWCMGQHSGTGSQGLFNISAVSLF